MDNVIDGKKLSRIIIRSVKEEIKKLRDKPRLGIIYVEDVNNECFNPNRVYLDHKIRVCRKAGIKTTLFHLWSGNYDEVISAMDYLNKTVDAIIVQLPLPSWAPINELQLMIPPEKDVDGFHPLNQGLLMYGRRSYLTHGAFPCTALAVYQILRSIDFRFSGRLATVIGQGLISGTPISQILINEEMTVTICHIKSNPKDISRSLRKSDLIVSAAGCPNLVKKEDVKDGAVVIDVGISCLPDDTIVGDVDFNEVKWVADWITPVPGGVGPMTVAILIRNTLSLYKKQRGIEDVY